MNPLVGTYLNTLVHHQFSNHKSVFFAVVQNISTTCTKTGANLAAAILEPACLNPRIVLKCNGGVKNLRHVRIRVLLQKCFVVKAHFSWPKGEKVGVNEPVNATSSAPSTRVAVSQSAALAMTQLYRDSAYGCSACTKVSMACLSLPLRRGGVTATCFCIGLAKALWKLAIKSLFSVRVECNSTSVVCASGFRVQCTAWHCSACKSSSDPLVVSTSSKRPTTFMFHS